MKLATESVLSAADKSAYSRRGQPGHELAHGAGEGGFILHNFKASHQTAPARDPQVSAFIL